MLFRSSEGVDKDSVYKRGGRAKKAYGGGFGQWLAGLQSGQSNAPYMNPSYQGSKAPYLPQEAPSQPAQKPAISNIDELYQYAFNRAPDEAGKQFWQQQQQSGMSLGDIANVFMGSEEAKGKYGEGLGNAANLIQSAFAQPSSAQNYQNYYTTGGNPIVNPDGTPVKFADVNKPTSGYATGDQGLYSEADIEAASKGPGPNPGMLIWAAQSGNPMMAIMAQQEADRAQAAATAKANEMRAHNALVKQQPKSPMGYFMQIDPNVMVNGRFGFNIISPYYYPDTATANPNLNPYGQPWGTPAPTGRKHGGKVEDRKGFDFGGRAYSPEAGQLPSMMTGPGSQTSPSSFGTGYNPGAFAQQRSEGGRAGYAGGGRAYGINDLVSIARQAGATPKEEALLASIAMAESSGDPMARNFKGKDLSYGLWQINMLGSMGPARRAQYGLKSNNDLYNPVTNAKVADRKSTRLNSSH